MEGGSAVYNYIDGGYCYVGVGLVSSSLIYAGGSMHIADGSASETFVSSGGSLDVNTSAKVTDTKVGIGGSMTVTNGSADILAIEKTGAVTINNGGKATNATINGGNLALRGAGTNSAGRASPIAVSSGSVNVSRYGVATSATLYSGGSLTVSSGGTANYTTVSSGGILRISATGIAADVTVTSGGSLAVSNGGTVTGAMNFAAGTIVSVQEGGTVDFDISSLDSAGEAILNDLSVVTGAPSYTITVSGSQAEGTYTLAAGAAGFTGTITVMNKAGVALGSLTVGGATDIGGVDYLLTLNSASLSVTVGSEPGPQPVAGPEFFTGDFDDGGRALFAVQKVDTAGTVESCSVKIYANGAEWGNGLALEPGWEVVGAGDFNADKKDDFLRVNTEGYVVGEMSNGDGTFAAQVLNLKNAGWFILGTGDFNGNGSDDVLIANPTAASETVGLLGYWESGVTWTLINGYSAEWEMVSTGDFNGDGKCDMLWKNEFIGEGDGTYNAYCTWIVEDPVDWRMVSVANPDEWNFLCSGDFDGNGSHDIAMINDVGVVGIWGVNDGYLSSWSILSAVTSEWTLAGVGDFNGDGTDDIAWSNTDTGLTGYWQINDKELTTWANLATLQAV